MVSFCSIMKEGKIQILRNICLFISFLYLMMLMNFRRKLQRPAMPCSYVEYSWEMCQVIVKLKRITESGEPMLRDMMAKLLVIIAPKQSPRSLQQQCRVTIIILAPALTTKHMRQGVLYINMRASFNHPEIECISKNKNSLKTSYHG